MAPFFVSGYFYKATEYGVMNLHLLRYELMKSVWLPVALVALFAAFLGGCATTSAVQQNLPIADPLDTRFEYEIELGKINEYLRQDLPAEQRGELLYRRGALYDAVGLRTLARVDFNQALEFTPRLANAYNYLGIHYIALEQYQYAYDALDSAIELSADHDYAYLNRGIAAYYDARWDLAQQDLLSYFEQEPMDPYRVLWLYLAEHELDAEQARADLATRREQLDDDEWAVQIIDVYLGRVKPENFLHSDMQGGAEEPEKATERLCEAYFYLGKLLQHEQEHEAAALYFKLARTTNVYEFVEHRFARLEMQRSLQLANSAQSSTD